MRPEKPLIINGFCHLEDGIANRETNLTGSVFHCDDTGSSMCDSLIYATKPDSFYLSAEEPIDHTGTKLQ